MENLREPLTKTLRNHYDLKGLVRFVSKFSGPRARKHAGWNVQTHTGIQMAKPVVAMRHRFGVKVELERMELYP